MARPGVDRDGWRDVRLLALVSLIGDISGEMLMAVLPFVLVAQGATGLGLGVVGGVTEGVGHAMKWVGGRVGQRMRRTVPLIGAGYLTAALSRFGVALATAWPATLAFRSLDRVGKGLRTAPRDALLAGAVPPSERARAFGLHRAADTTGAVLGVLAALAGLAWVGASERQIVLVAAAVGLTSVVPLFFVREPALPPPVPGPGSPVEARTPGYLAFLAVAATFSLGHVSYLFFLVRSTAGGASVESAVLWYLLFNVVYAAASYPFGMAADRWGRRRVLLVGFLLTALSALPFLAAPDPFLLTAGFAVLGLSYAAVEGNLRALAADLAGERARSTRLGEFHALVGFATLVGGIAAGLLWDKVGARWAFAWCAAVSLLAAVGLAWMLRNHVAERIHSAPTP